MEYLQSFFQNSLLFLDLLERAQDMSVRNAVGSTVDDIKKFYNKDEKSRIMLISLLSLLTLGAIILMVVSIIKRCKNKDSEYYDEYDEYDFECEDSEDDLKF